MCIYIYIYIYTHTIHVHVHVYAPERAAGDLLVEEVPGPRGDGGVGAPARGWRMRIDMANVTNKKYHMNIYIYIYTHMCLYVYI